MASEKIAALIEEIKVLTVIELSELVKAVEETEYDDSLNVKNGFCAGVVIVKDGNFNSFEDIVRLADSRLYGAKGKIKRENGLAVESMVMGIDDDN